MFKSTTVPMVFRRMALELGEDADGPTRLCKCTFRLPVLSFPLASTMEVKARDHCFGKDGFASWDLDDVLFAPPEQYYRVAVASAPDMVDEPLITLKAASLEKIRVWRPKKTERDLALELVTLHTLARGDSADLAAVVTAWEVSRVWLLFEHEQPSLALDGGDDKTPPRLVKTKSDAAHAHH